MSQKSSYNPELCNLLYPVSGVIVYEKVLVIQRSNLGQNSPRKPGKRKPITHITRKSTSKFLFRMITSGVSWRSMITLTYGQNFPMSGRKVKRDIKTFRKRFFRRWGKQPFAWFLEFQERGAPHFHAFVQMDVCDQEQREELARLWADIAEAQDWPYTAIKWPYKREMARQGLFTQQAVFSNHKRRRTWENARKQDGVIRYVVSYVTKPHQKLVPVWFRDVGRYWGISGVGTVGCSAEFIASELEVRQLATLLGRNVDNMTVLPKYLFHSGDLPK